LGGNILSWDYPENLGDFEKTKKECPMKKEDHCSLKWCIGYERFEKHWCADWVECPAIKLFKVFGLL
jgi:hypothetical protein